MEEETEERRRGEEEKEEGEEQERKSRTFTRGEEKQCVEELLDTRYAEPKCVRQGGA